MRRAKRVLGLMVAASVGLSCNSSTTPATLQFNVAESLLVLDPNDASSGYVLLSSGTGACAALQSGLTVFGNAQVGNFDYVILLLGQLDAAGQFVALTAGTYGILDPTASFNPPGLIANAAIIASDPTCNVVETDASSGTLTVAPFDTADGGTSAFNYSAIFGASVVTGTYSLTTCLVPDTTPLADAGTCAVCTGGTPDGGACAIP
jgi:hypothetical protein